MLYREFGKTGKKVSALGFGCMRFPIHGHNPTDINEEEATKMLDYAFDNGVNYFDTAWTYHRDNDRTYTEQGKSEFFMGKYIKDKRDKLYLATKNPIFFVEKADEPERYLDAQLEALGTDYIDFYLLHSLYADLWGTVKTLGVLKMLEKAKSDGRIRHIGFSFHDEYDIFTKIVDEFDWEFCLVQHNYLDIDFQAGTNGIKYAADKGMGVAVMEPLKGGRLARPYPEELLAEAEKLGVEPPALALRFVLDKPEVGVALSGMSTIEQVKDNVKVASGIKPGALTQEERGFTQKVRSIYKNKEIAGCTACGYCMPCPAGVDIPGCIDSLNDFSITGNLWRVKSEYDMRDNNTHAEHCINCGVCLDKCPQHLDIPSLMEQAHAKFGIK
ncbi:MAG: aldo/keto reductase [Christensenellales bacterium]|jgi:predicted aldo/keto reductase-like oxidoreductase